MTVERTTLGDGYEISRMIRGGWQLAGDHGAVDRARAIDDMLTFFDRGITAFDCADIYTGVEEMYGAFRTRLRDTRDAEAAKSLKIHTKFVPDYDKLGRVDRAYVTEIIDRSLQRLKTDRLDLVQLHWWNYAVPGAVETTLMLRDLKKAGKIDRIGGTNFDTPHSAALMAAGVPLASMQMQYSLLDTRPENGLVALAEKSGMRLLCYGVLAGGLLSEAWLGRPEPRDDLTNRSQIKYKLVIDDFGGWALFQELLRALDKIAKRYGVNISSVAARWVLDRPGVAAVIIGARYAQHLDGNLGMFKVRLDTEDHALLAPILARRTGPLGDTYTLERDKDGRHGRIMKYNLNKS